MLGVLFGWRKASKCKKLLKKVQCRLKLLRNKRSAVVKQLREDIAQLLRNGHDHVAISRLEQLYMDENMKEVYELLDNFCEFVLMNLSYIRRHRDCSNEVNEAISSLIFASARFGELPELQVIRKLFGEWYGHKFATTAVELLPGNLVNPQMREKLSKNSASEYAKNRLLDEIIRECFFQPGLLAIEYNPSPQTSQIVKHSDTQPMVSASMKSPAARETENHPTDFEFPHSINEEKELIQSPQAKHENDTISLSTNCSIALQPSSPNTTPEKITINRGVEKLAVFALPSPFPHDQSSSSEYPEQSLVYLDDIEEFKSRARKDVHMVDEQDQRMFIFKPLKIQKPAADQPETQSCHSSRKSARKRQRRRSLSKDYKQSINDTGYEVYYSGSPHQRKHHKKIHGVENSAAESDLDGLVHSFRFWLKEEESETCSSMVRSSSGIGNGALTRPPYLRATSMPQQKDRECKTSDLGRSASFPLESPAELRRRASSSPRHVHPNLPDYEELEAKFIALKKVHQQSELVVNAG